MIKLYCLFMLLVSVSFSIEDDHQPAEPSAGRKNRRFSQRAPGEDPCLGGRGLAAFANGEDYNMPGMIALLTEPACQRRYTQITREALAQRISFFDEPFRFQQLAANFNPNSLKSVEQANQTLERVLPLVLKNHPMTNEAILPVLGQTAILSQGAARKVLAEMIQSELVASAPLMKASSQDKNKLALDLAQTLLSLGASSSSVGQEVAKATEELALSAQVDSLSKILSALADAARAEDSLVSTLEQTVGAAQKGVEKGQKFTSFSNRQKLLLAFFENVKPAFFSEPEFEGVSEKYNQALKTLLQNQELGRTILRDLWRECVKVLANNRQQKALALALGLSLSKEVIYLGELDMNNLLLAANQHPSVAVALQRSFLASWNEMWDQLFQKEISPAVFNKKKATYFIPLVEKILELDAQALDVDWLKLVWEKNFVKDPQIESRFPKLVLYHLKKNERESQELSTLQSFEGVTRSLAQSMATHRALSSVAIPALKAWLANHQPSTK